jgi:hypothetical protein
METIEARRGPICSTCAQQRGDGGRHQQGRGNAVTAAPFRYGARAARTKAVRLSGSASGVNMGAERAESERRWLCGVDQNGAGWPAGVRVARLDGAGFSA